MNNVPTNGGISIMDEMAGSLVGQIPRDYLSWKFYECETISGCPIWKLESDPSTAGK